MEQGACALISTMGWNDSMTTVAESIQPDNLKEYVVDMKLRPSKRLKEVVAGELDAAISLFKEARKEFKDVPELVLQGFGALYREYDGAFQGEIQTWADALKVSFGEVAVVNCGYELDHLEHRWSIPELIWKIISPFGCTTGIREVMGWGMAHLRTLDWPLPKMAEATRLFRYRKGTHEFVSVGFPGFVGALSGMVPGEYSATINWAPPSDMPDFHIGPSFLLRKTLEECRTYQEAVAHLKRVRLSTSVFFTVCGKAPGEGCVIERTAEKSVVRPLLNGIEAQSNHYVSNDFDQFNGTLVAYKTDPLIPTTCKRRERMLENLAAAPTPAKSLAELFPLMSVDPVKNEETIQRMIFCPAKGELHLDRRISTSAAEDVWGRSLWKASQG